MNPLLDSFWRALAYCVHPRVIAMSLLPLAIMVALALGLGWFFWQPALDWAGAWVASSSVLGAVIGWLEGFGFDSLRAMLPAVIVVLLSTPVIVVVALLVVVAWMRAAAARCSAACSRRREPRRRRSPSSCSPCRCGWCRRWC